MKTLAYTQVSESLIEAFYTVIDWAKLMTRLDVKVA